MVKRVVQLEGEKVMPRGQLNVLRLLFPLHGLR